MHQVIQNIRSGQLTVTTVPEPLAQPGHVLVAKSASLISAGTKKMRMELARKSLLGTALDWPDQVRCVLAKHMEGFHLPGVVVDLWFEVDRFPASDGERESRFEC
ncbi:MAG: hypothetical protein V1792_29800 [Pseudomonadota bacterium]